MKNRYIVLLSEATRTCGVEEFARLLAGRMHARLHVLGTNPFRFLKALKGADAVVFNFPVVAWKRKFLSPSLTALATRLCRREVVVVLHEWSNLDWKRRLLLIPVLLLATRVFFSAPEIASEFAETKLSFLTSRRRGVLPIPPNILPPDAPQSSAHSECLRMQRQAGRMIIGQFGSIYPKKQSTAVLHVAAHLLEQGHDIGIVLAGSFIKGMDDVEGQFFDLARKLGVMDRLLVTGYIGGERELFAILGEVDVFCYLFPTGLTSRRGSVLTAALSGRPVVVNAPERSGALAHHGLFQRLVAIKAIHLTDTDADFPAVADAVLEAREARPGKFDFDAEIEAVWQTIAATVNDA